MTKCSLFPQSSFIRSEKSKMARYSPPLKCDGVCGVVKDKWVSQGVTQNSVRVNLAKRNYPGQIVYCELESLIP